MALVDDLLANTGTYIGIDTMTGSDMRGAARIEVAALPGRSGVTLDYESFNPAIPDRVRPHVEHTMVTRTHDGSTLMLVAHPHASSAALLRETAPGMFEAGDQALAFPMKIELSVPEPGRILHTWWYGQPGGVAEPRDATDARRVD